MARAASHPRAHAIESLEVLNQTRDCQQCQSGDGEKECVRGQSGDRLKVSEQRKHTQDDRDPPCDVLWRREFHLLHLLIWKLIFEWGPTFGPGVAGSDNL